VTVVRVEVDEGVALVTLDAPERRNAITLPMVDQLVAAFDELEPRADVSAVVVTGAGAAFCAGADLGDLALADRATFLAIYEAFLRVARSTLPTIAAVNGPAVGAGMNLALACDVRVVGESGRFVTRFLDLGLHPGGGHTWMLARAVGHQRAAAMLLFAQELRGAEAVTAGLALRCVPDEELVAAAVELGRCTTRAPKELLVRSKATLAAVMAIQEHGEALDLELTAQVWSSRQPFFAERLRRR
jgi:enoyl-CoA hydratase